MNTLTLIMCWFLLTISFVFPIYSFGASLDLRNLSDESGEYEIGFCSRPSPNTIKNLPGHAFVSFSAYLSNGNRTFKSIGHTIQENTSLLSTTWSYFGDSVVGYLSEEKYTSIEESCLLVKVNKTDYEKALLLTTNPLQTMGLASNDAPVLEAYSLGANDCMSFMIDVARAIESKGFIVPDRNAGELPLDYIGRLIDANIPSVPMLHTPTGFKIN